MEEIQRGAIVIQELPPYTFSIDTPLADTILPPALINLFQLRRLFSVGDALKLLFSGRFPPGFERMLMTFNYTKERLLAELSQDLTKEELLKVALL